MRILLVEDDDQLAEVLTLGLRQEAYAVDRVADLAAALDACRLTAYDVACVDLGLPDGDGLELLRRLPVSDDHHRPRRMVVITARDAVEQRVAGLDAGADDYLVKPFDFAELTARVRAVSRRTDQHDATITVGELVIDTAGLSVTRGGRPIELTAREFAILRYLAIHPGEVISAERLLDHVWDANADPFTTSVRVLLSRLRRKLGPPPVIETVTGAGYRLIEG
ncbi:MAG: response regulator transcription factor [Actinomycetota bacterium]